MLTALLLFATTLTELKWMTGHWSGTIDGVAMEEVWLAPEGGVMLSMHRDVRKDGKASFEFARIAETKDGIVFLAQPGGRPATPFKLVESSEHRVVFANPEHDYPERITYWLTDGNLCARVEGKDGADAEEWCWSPAK